MPRRRLPIPHRSRRSFRSNGPQPLRGKRALRVENLERRELLAATPLGATVHDTGEFLLGSVGVVPVLFESDGSIDSQSQDWTAEEIDSMLATVGEGVNWWAEALDRLDTVHSLEFVVDDTYARTPFTTGFEPIDRISDSFSSYAGDFLTSLGYGDAGSFEAAVHQFNHDQRLRLGTDWAFSIFIADASDDPDGQFALGGSFSRAFAFAGGLFVVMPSTRPASTVAHEMGHIFWARDEYPGGGSWTDTRGYYNAQNLNAWDNSTAGFSQEESIMRGGWALQTAYEAYTSSPSSFEMIGWRDSDDDGVFDVADVPLRLDAVGYFDQDSGRYHLTGSATAVPLRNANSWGPQSDITLNRISHLQYSVDGGAWITAESPDLQQVDFELSIALDSPPSQIRWRAVDETTGITSNILEATSLSPLVSEAAMSGFAFVDANGNGQRDGEETLLENTTIVISNADGSGWFSGAVLAEDYVDSPLPRKIAGISLAADGLAARPEAGVATSARAGGIPVFRYYNYQLAKWRDGWTDKTALVLDFQQPVGQVEADLVGLEQHSYGRIEAFDAQGNSLGRSTSGELGIGERRTLRFEDAAGRIAKVRIFGHASSEIAIEGVRHGVEPQITTGPSGAWQINNLPDGIYRVDVSPELPIYDFASATREVTSGSGEFVVLAGQRVDSPRHNAELPQDVNRDEAITAIDALLVINDLVRNQARILPHGEGEGLNAVDVTNDGRISPLDALWVINALSRASQAAEGESSLATTVVEDPVPAPSAVQNRSTSSKPSSTDDERLADDQPQDLSPPASSGSHFSSTDTDRSPNGVSLTPSGESEAEDSEPADEQVPGNLHPLARAGGWIRQTIGRLTNG